MKKIFVFCFLICTLISGCKKSIRIEKFNFDTVQNIAELAVLRCKFNNVAIFNKPKDKGFLNKFQKDKQAFVEYIVDIKIGIDANKINVNGHTITIPKAEILSADEIGGEIVVSKDGLKANKIDKRDEQKTYKKYTEEMKKDIEEDGKLLIKAQKIVRDNILQYIEMIDDNNYKVVLE